MFADAARIVRFWQAVETFNPQPLPRPDFRENVTDVRTGDPLPWEAGSRLAARRPAAGMTWRHQVFGGLFEVAAVRAALAGLFGDDDPGGDARDNLAGESGDGESALFACTVDANGVLLGRAAVSECAWALGRAMAGEGDPSSWLTGFEREAPSGDGPPAGQPLTADDLRRFADALAGRLGVTALAPAGLRVRSYQVPAGAPGDDWDPPGRLLGSSFAGDLALVAAALRGRDGGMRDGGMGHALAEFLCSGEEVAWDSRVDVRQDPLVVLDGCAPNRIPLGRWVAGTGHPLVRSQQFAVNEIIARLAPGGGLFTVHAPPGTGATAVFSDLVAAIVVERARRLAELPDTRAAFAGSHTWQAGAPGATGATIHTVTAPAPALTGFEVVLAAPNSPDDADAGDLGDIGAHWRDRASKLDYFASTARLTSGDGAWGLIAARLGDRSEQRGFVERCWQGTVRGTDALFAAGETMPAALRRPAETAADWPAAVARFSEAMEKVNFLSSERTVASASIARFSDLEQAVEDASWSLEGAEQRCAELAARELAVTSDVTAAEELSRAALADLEAHQSARPGLRSGLHLRAGLRAGREWNAAHGALRAAYAEAELRRDAALREAESVRAGLDAARLAAAKADEEVARLTAEMARLQELVAQARRRWTGHVPGGPAQEETDDDALIERREKSAPWADAEFMAARTELFLAALALHKALIAAEADTMERNLGTLMDILSGQGEPPAAVALAAWQSFFLVVPVVSATFASVGSLFAGLGSGSLGWLLADRAGQVPPQQVLGALWRADRAVLAGDPLQAMPAGPLPWSGQQALLAALEVDEEWAPARSCAQRVADRLARNGTWLPVEAPDGSGRLWVGAPLRVHRRSDRPILQACNEIAYDGLLVCGTPDADPFPGADAWYDVRSGAAGAACHRTAAGHWIAAEGEVLLSVLTSLRAAGVPATEVRVVSPFGAVAAAAARVYSAVFGEVSAEELRTRVGTVHTVRSGDVVILVLGGDPGRPDARARVSHTPHLLNSAIGRARRRLYVIGDRDAWASQPYFEVLARRLPDAEPAPLDEGFETRTNLAG